MGRLIWLFLLLAGLASPGSSLAEQPPTSQVKATLVFRFVQFVHSRLLNLARIVTSEDGP